MVVVAALQTSNLASAQSDVSVEVFLPDQLGVEEMEGVKFSLSLSDAQKVILNQLHASYMQRWNEESERKILDIRTAGFEAGRRFYSKDGGGYGWDAIIAFEDFEKKRMALLKAYGAVDSEFWTSIEPLLSEEQVAQLFRARQQRDRDRCRLTNREIHGSRIDLNRLIRRHGVEPTPGSDLDMVMAEYDDAISRIWLDLDENLCRTEIDTLQAAAELLFGHPAPLGRDSHQGMTYKQRMSQLKRPALRLERRIVTINTVFLPRMVELLPAETRVAVNGAYDAVAYPALYPDRFDPTPIFELTLQETLLTDDLRNILKGIWLSYRDSYEAIQRRMERMEDDWWEEFALTRGATDLERFRDVMRNLRNMRCARSRQVVVDLLAALPDPVARSMSPTADDYVQQVDLFLSSSMEENWPR